MAAPLQGRALLVLDAGYVVGSKSKPQGLNYQKLISVLEQEIGVTFYERWWVGAMDDRASAADSQFYRGLRSPPPRGPNIRTLLLNLKSHTCVKCHHRAKVQKGVDVAIATLILKHCYTNLCDTVVLFAGDGDFFEALRIIKDELRKKVVIVAYDDQSLSSDISQLANQHVMMEQIRHRIIGPLESAPPPPDNLNNSSNANASMWPPLRPAAAAAAAGSLSGPPPGGGVPPPSSSSSSSGFYRPSGLWIPPQDQAPPNIAALQQQQHHHHQQQQQPPAAVAKPSNQPPPPAAHVRPSASQPKAKKPQWEVVPSRGPGSVHAGGAAKPAAKQASKAKKRGPEKNPKISSSLAVLRQVTDSNAAVKQWEEAAAAAAAASGANEGEAGEDEEGVDEGPGPHWECRFCTFVNEVAEVRECGMCGQEWSGAGADTPPAFESPRLNNNPSAPAAAAASDNNQPASVQPQPQPPPPSSSSVAAPAPAPAQAPLIAARSTTPPLASNAPTLLSSSQQPPSSVVQQQPPPPPPSSAAPPPAARATTPPHPLVVDSAPASLSFTVPQAAPPPLGSFNFLPPPTTTPASLSSSQTLPVLLDGPSSHEVPVTASLVSSDEDFACRRCTYHRGAPITCPMCDAPHED